ncbi:secondary thiamine-phosphate synthase enzyme YjbQ [bacterium]|nr:secondary thiamine-phosphate synthase enzyme YjbQ [bacterium]
MKVLQVKTHKKEELIDLTSQVKKAIRDSGVSRGTCIVYVPHTTSAVTINENADPSVRSDILMSLKKMVPDSLPYTHSEGNSPAHVKSSLIGPFESIIIEDNRAVLGTWQGIFFCEFDGPRNRKAYIEIRPHSSP